MITTEVVAASLLMQLDDEMIDQYSTGVGGKTIEDIIDDLLDFQTSLTPITKGTIEPTETVVFSVTLHSILWALRELYLSVGGYFNVNNDRIFNWLNDIGETKGQQLRYRKNLKGIERETDYTSQGTILYAIGANNLLLNENVIFEIGEKSSDATYGYLTLPSKYAAYMGWTALGDPLPDEVSVSLDDNPWRSPTSNDGTDWVLPKRGYDENLNTYTYVDIPGNSWSTYLKMNMAAPITSSKLKFAAMFPYTNGLVEVQVLEGADWTTVYGGGFVPDTIIIANYPSQLEVSAVRVRVYNPFGTSKPGGLWDVWIFDDDTISDIWVQGADERTLRCDIGDFIGMATYYINYRHASYLVAWDAIGEGRITKTYRDSSIIDPAILLAAGRIELDRIKIPYIFYAVTALDLSEINNNFNFDRLQIGSIVTVIDEDLGIDVSARVVRRSYPNLIGQPHNMELEISTEIRDITDTIAEIKRQL